MDTVYGQIKTKGEDFKCREEGIQLVKVVGKVNPDDITQHMNDAKNLYDKKDGDDGGSVGTTVQCVTVSRPNKDGVKEPVQFIKATRGKVPSGEDPIAFYKVKGGTDVRDILDQIQEKGKPDGQDGVDYDKVKGEELPEVKKLFDGNKDMPKTYYYSSNVKGNELDKNGKPYKDGKVHSVTVLSDPNNRINKNYQVLQSI